MLETSRWWRRSGSTSRTGFSGAANSSSTGRRVAVSLHFYAIVGALITALNHGSQYALAAGEREINLDNWSSAHQPLLPKATINQSTDHKLTKLAQITAATRRLQLVAVDAPPPQPLAVKHGRIDPLHHFKKYRGGYNLQGKHYLASTLYTGVHGYLFGALWLLGGVIWAIALCIRHWKLRKRVLERQPSSKLSTSKSGIKLVPILLAALLTALIIAACGVLFVGNQRFHTIAKRVERTILVEGPRNATRLIDRVTQSMGQMRMDIEPYDKMGARRLDNTTSTLNKAAITFLNIVHNHTSVLDSALISLNIGVIAITASNIALWTLGLACLCVLNNPNLGRLFLWIVALAWFLVFLNWVAFGFTFAVSKTFYCLFSFADDTCVALKEYQVTSRRSTTLDNVLPCNDLASGNKMVFRFRQKIYTYIEQANKNISKLYKLNVEQATTSIPHVCNPFSGPPTYVASSNCMEGTISLSSLPQLLSTFKCSNTTSISQSCIPVKQYNAANAYIAATEKLLSMLPDMENLIGCSFVVETFTAILRKQCKPLKHSIRMVWIAMVVLSTLTTFTMFLWLLHFFFVAKHLWLLWLGGTILPHDHPTTSP